MWKYGVALVAAVVLSGGALSAQERQAEEQQNRARANQQREGAAAGAQQAGAQRGAEGRQSQAQRVDQSVAAMLAVGNWSEIQLGQYASQKSQNPQVKEFAQQLVQDHTQFLQKIQPFLPPGQFDDLRAGEGSASGTRSRTGAGARDGAPGARSEGAAAARTEGAAAAAAGDDQAADQLAQAETQRAKQARQAGQQGDQAQQGGRNPIWQIQKEAGRKALEMTKEILNEKQGNDFDKCFVSGQIGSHIQSLAKLEAAQDHVSPEFQQVIREGQQTVEQHLKHARTLAQQLEGQEGAQPGQPRRGAARPGAQPGAAQPGAAQPGATRPAQPGAQPAAPRTEEP